MMDDDFVIRCEANYLNLTRPVIVQVAEKTIVGYRFVTEETCSVDRARNVWAKYRAAFVKFQVSVFQPKCWST